MSIEEQNWKTNPNLFTEKIKGLKTKPKIKRIRTEMKAKYLLNFNWRRKLKQIKTSTIEIRTIQNNHKIRDWNENTIKPRGLPCNLGYKREKRGENQLIVVMFSATMRRHEHHHVVDNMAAHSMDTEWTFFTTTHATWRECK